MRYVAGIDLGTSSTKTVIMDLEGRIAGIGHGSYEIQIPVMSYAEQDPRQWWEAVKRSIGEACANAKLSPSMIEGIGFSGQMHGLVALDENKKPVGPAVIHLDQRSAVELPRIRQLAGDLMTEELLNVPSAGMMISTLYWMKERWPEKYGKIRYVMSPKDYIRFCLCGEIGTECTDAGATLAFSVKQRKWCSALFDRLGIRKDIWPKVYESYEVAGYVSAPTARETGLSERTALVYGAGDSMAALTGNGVIEKGIMACNIGTSSQLAVVADVPVFDRQLRIQTWCHTVAGRWVVQSGTLNGGSTLSWLRDKILKSKKSFGELDREAGSVSAGADGLFFIPYLAGERTPYNDPYARGIYFGLGMKHEQAHLVRATMEGVLFNLRECLDILDEMQVSRERLIASGGAARGATWKHIQADILNMPVYTTNVEEEACQGAAILAAVGIGAYKSVQEACQAIVTMGDEVVEPTAEHVRIYQEKQEMFRELYFKVKDLYPQIR